MAKKASNAVIAMNPEDNWRAESDLRTLTDAQAINKDPKRMAAVKALAKKRLEEMEEAGLTGQHKGGKYEAGEKSEADDKD